MKHDFYAGQRVRIREWDDMLREYGGDEHYIDIPAAHCFVRDMRHLCGLEATIEVIDGDSVVLCNFDTPYETDYFYNIYMIEQADIDPFIEFNEKSFIEMLDLS